MGFLEKMSCFALLLKLNGAMLSCHYQIVETIFQTFFLTSSVSGKDEKYLLRSCLWSRTYWV